MSTSAAFTDTIANIAEDIRNQGPNEYHALHNARELAEVSQYAHTNNMYTPAFEDRLAVSLKHSIASGVYRRTSLPTPPPANIVQSLRSRA